MTREQHTSFMEKIEFDNSYIDKVISEHPYVKLLAIPKYNENESRWEALAQVNSMIAIIEVTIKPIESK